MTSLLITTLNNSKMSGIAGILKFNGETVTPDEIKAMTDTLILRGPDSGGFYVTNSIGIGYRRLSVIDCMPAEQPIYNEEKGLALVFNGSIYNNLNIKDLLISHGHNFQTNTDPEVIVHGYEEWGLAELLNKLEGPFSFCLHDFRKKETYIVRDKYGESPLYYLHDDTKIAFASEIKALCTIPFDKTISTIGLNFFLSLSYIPAPYSIYQSVNKLKAANYLKIKDNSIETVCYYSIQQQICKSTISFEDAKTKLKTLLIESMRKQMKVDVDLGAFLSGGIDSSIVVALMSQLSDNPVNTFSIGFRESTYDESHRAKLIAEKFKTNHTTHYLNYDDVVDEIDEIVNYFDEPYGDSSAIPSYYVAKVASSTVKVALTGDCADELFGGYEKYLSRYYTQKWRRIPGLLRRLIETGITIVPHNRKTNKLLRRVKKVMSNAMSSGFEMDYKYMCLGFQDVDRQHVIKQKYFVDIKKLLVDAYGYEQHNDNLNSTMLNDVRIVLEGDMFPKADRCGMMSSIEERAPFMNRQLVEFALGLPVEYKVKGKKNKHILKETFKDMLPVETLSFPKNGFGVPIDYWFQNQLKGELKALLSEEKIEKQGIFNTDVIQKLLVDHMTGKANNKGMLWNLFVFQKWYYKHFPQS